MGGRLFADSPEPHVQEGVCTCPTEVACFSLTCGLSTHRVKAAAQRELERRGDGTK